MDSNINKNEGVGDSNKKQSKHYILTLSASIIVVLISVAIFEYVHTEGLSTHITTINYYTTTLTTTLTTSISPNSSILFARRMEKILNFMNSYDLPISNKSFYKISPELITIPSCNFSGYVKWYIENGFSSNPNIPQNYSKLNQSMPFSYFYIIGISNTTSIYNKIITKNGGFCSPTIEALSSNSSFTHYNTVFYNGIDGYILVFTNFTPEGYNITYSYYVGPKPDIAFYYTSFIYNNTIFKVGVWGFRQSMNITNLEYLTNDLIKTYLSR